jgi:hypothetical protein
VSKRKLPILKPAEVVTKLVALGFEEVRQKGRTSSFVTQTAAAQRSLSIRDETSPRSCSGRLLEISE